MLDIFSFVVTKVEKTVGQGIVVGKSHDFAADSLHHFLIHFGGFLGVQPFFDFVGKSQG